MEPDAALQAALAHLKGLLNEAKQPDLPPELADLPDLAALHAYVAELRTVFADFSCGNFSRRIGMQGFLAGEIKAYQADISHLIWQIGQVAKGDFSQRIMFMGDLAEAFNGMVKQLDEARTELRRKEEELTQSEARFKYLADHDPLTGILNRRAFFGLAAMELSKAAESGEPCCIAISRDGAKLAIGARDRLGCVYEYDLSEGIKQVFLD